MIMDSGLRSIKSCFSLPRFYERGREIPHLSYHHEYTWHESSPKYCFHHTMTARSNLTLKSYILRKCSSFTDVCQSDSKYRGQ